MTYTFLQISKHTPDVCPMYNDKYKKATLDLIDKIEPLASKHGMKFVGSWNVHPEHLVYNVYEAPTMEAFQQFSMEPEMVTWNAFNTSEIKMAMGYKEVGALIKQGHY